MSSFASSEPKPEPVSAQDDALMELLGVYAYRKEENAAKEKGSIDVDALRELLKGGANAYAFDDVTGTTALMSACARGDVEASRELLIRGAPWNARDRRGKCAGGE